MRREKKKEKEIIPLEALGDGGIEWKGGVLRRPEAEECDAVLAFAGNLVSVSCSPLWFYDDN